MDEELDEELDVLLELLLHAAAVRQARAATATVAVLIAVLFGAGAGTHRDELLRIRVFPSIPAGNDVIERSAPDGAGPPAQ